MKKTTEAAGPLVGLPRVPGEGIRGHRAVFRALADDHDEISALLRRVGASDEDAETREALFARVRVELRAHAKAEESCFYPALLAHAPLQPLVERSLQRHQAIEDQVEDLTLMDAASVEWSERFAELARAVEEHVELEQEEVFPLADEVLSSEQSRDLERDFVEAKEARRRSI